MKIDFKDNITNSPVNIYYNNDNVQTEKISTESRAIDRALNETIEHLNALLQFLRDNKGPIREFWNLRRQFAASLIELSSVPDLTTEELGWAKHLHSQLFRVHYADLLVELYQFKEYLHQSTFPE